MDSDQIGHIPTTTDLLLDAIAKCIRRYAKRLAEGDSLEAVSKEAARNAQLKLIEAEAEKHANVILLGQQHATSVVFQPIDIDQPKLKAVN